MKNKYIVGIDPISTNKSSVGVCIIKGNSILDSMVSNNPKECQELMEKLVKLYNAPIFHNGKFIKLNQ